MQNERDSKKPKRKGIKGIACGLASSFSSRNNDINRCWAIGQLYKFVKINNTLEVKIDLLESKTSIQSNYFDTMAKKYSDKMFEYLKKYNLGMENVLKAEISVSFDPTEIMKTRTGWFQKETFNKFNCEVRILDDHGVLRKGNYSGWCYPDNILRV
jgi:hypothetical protein